MSELVVEAVVNERTVIDYDFMFSSGLVLQITVDKELGDTIEFNPNEVVIYTSSKPSIVDPDSRLPAETMHLNRAHLLSHQYRERTFRDLTPEEKYERAALWASSKPSDTIN